MQVTLFDPPLRWHVSSEHLHPDYLVDLSEFDGNGRCDCKHFRCILLHDLEAGKRGRKFMCKHLRAAREHLADLVVQKFLQDEKLQKQVKLKYDAD